MAFNRGPKIVTQGLVLALDAASNNSYPGSGTTWKDLSGNNNTGTLVNGPTFSSANGGTFILDGSNDYINAGSINLNRDFTLEIITNMTSTSSLYGLFGQGTGNTNQGLHMIYDAGARGMIYGMYSNDNDYNNNYRPSTGVWYHWVFTYNNSSYAKQFYANAVLQTPGSSVQNVYSGTGQFNIGAAYSAALYPANGKIAVARVYSRVLTATEISQNYNATKSRFNL